MEDCKLNYDNTVRNASGSIIQFLYGEDGMEGTKIESQTLSYIDYDYSKLQREFLLTKNDDLRFLLDEKTLKEFESSKDWEKRMEDHFDQVLADRKFMIKDVFNSKKDTMIMYPVSFVRIINNAKALFCKYVDVQNDLNPVYVLDTIEKLAQDLYINKNNPGNRFLGILIRFHLSPKKMVVGCQFNKNAFEYVVEQVRMKFYDAIANPSEMVGVIAAQSIGEPATQILCCLEQAA